jgi:hypothetical protein
MILDDCLLFRLPVVGAQQNVITLGMRSAAEWGQIADSV